MDSEGLRPTSVFFWGFLNKQKQQTVPKALPELNKCSVTKVASGGFFLLAANDSGELWGWGNPKHSRFGVQGTDDIEIPRRIPLKVKVSKISAGNWHSMIIDTDGILFGSGHNKYGSLGMKHFDNVNEYSPVPVKFKARQVSCGDGFTLAICSEGDLYSSGHHSFHGRPSKQNKNQFKRICEGEKFLKISAGFTHSLAAAVSGDVYSWGEGNFFQLGHGNKNDQQVPKKIEKLAGVKIVDVSCTRGEKYAHSMAVSAQGEVFTWGSGYKGKLGHHTEWSHADPADEPEPKIIKDIGFVAARVLGGGIHSAVMSNDGSLFTFGCGSDGRLGHAESADHRYLYREGLPRKIQALEGWKVLDACCSYYQNICVAIKIEK